MHYFYEEKGTSIRAGYSDTLEFGAHIHGHLELVYMLDGQTKAAVDFNEYTVAEGDAFLVFPNQVHSYYQDHVKKCIIVIFPQEICPEFRTLFLQKQPCNPVLSQINANPEVVQLLTKIIELEDNQFPYNKTLRKGYFLEILSLLFARMNFVEQEPANSTTIKKVLNYCAEHFMSDITLEMIASDLHVNKYYISHLFQQKLHMGFRQYINMLRVSETQRLLRRKEISITQIAYYVGFNSTRSFNRVFYKNVNMTPRQYMLTEGSDDE